MRQVDVLNKALDDIRTTKGMYSFSGCHYSKNLKLTESGDLEVTISIPASQINCTDLREFDANHKSYENLTMLPVFVLVDPEEFKETLK